MDPEAPNAHQDQLPAALDPQSWTDRQTYATLKHWLKNAIWLNQWSPLIIPPTAVPISYLSRPLTGADAKIRTHLRSIIPELLSEWHPSDSRDVLESLLILCGALSCNEAEMVIDRIIVNRLRDDNDADGRCRSRALSVLQSIGTERTLHLFLRYIDNPRHTALCYRGLYRSNPRYAATELPALIRRYKERNQTDTLRDVLDLLFHDTLTPREYVTVLRPLVEEANPDCFVEVLEELAAVNVFSEAFFASLSNSQSADVFGPLLKRAREEDCEKIVNVLERAGMTIEPPATILEVTPLPLEPDPLRLQKEQGSLLPVADEQFYGIIGRKDGQPLRLPIANRRELDGGKWWPLTRDAKPDILYYLNSPTVIKH